MHVCLYCLPQCASDDPIKPIVDAQSHVSSHHSAYFCTRVRPIWRQLFYLLLTFVLACQLLIAVYHDYGYRLGTASLLISYCTACVGGGSAVVAIRFSELTHAVPKPGLMPRGKLFKKPFANFHATGFSYCPRAISDLGSIYTRVTGAHTPCTFHFLPESLNPLSHRPLFCLCDQLRTKSTGNRT